MTAEQIAGLCVLAGATLGALGYIVRKIRDGVRWLERLSSLVGDVRDRSDQTGQLVDRELERNHGSSMRDVVNTTQQDVAAVAGRVGHLWRELIELRRDFDNHVKKGQNQ